MTASSPDERSDIREQQFVRTLHPDFAPLIRATLALERTIILAFPGCGAARSGAPLVRDRHGLGAS
jgi:hypothetical protein